MVFLYMVFGVFFDIIFMVLLFMTVLYNMYYFSVTVTHHMLFSYNEWITIYKLNNSASHVNPELWKSSQPSVCQPVEFHH